MSILEARNISLTYGGKKPKQALIDLSFNVKEGDFTTILGPNGSGKSTLLRILAGLLEPTGGSVQFKGKSFKNISRKNIARKIAYVPQKNFSVFPFSVIEIVMMGRSPHLNYMGIERYEDVEVVNNALEVMGITDLADKGINEISGGEAQRAFIARAIAQQPEVILLDEPNAHLDIEHQISIFKLLKKLNREDGVTVITVSHDLNLAGHFTNDAVLLKDGSLFSKGSKKKVLTEENLYSVFGVECKIESVTDMQSINVIVKP